MLGQHAYILQCTRASATPIRPGRKCRSTVSVIPAARALAAANTSIEDTIMDAKTGANIKTGKLTLGDKNYSFPIYDGTIGPEVLDVSKLYAETGIFTYDPGFTSTGSCESKITYIDGDEGILRATQVGPASRASSGAG